MKSKLTNRVAALEAHAAHVEQRRNPPLLIVHFTDKKGPRPPAPPYPPGSIEVRFVNPKAKRSSKTRAATARGRTTKKESRQ
jgi:hypothetical protein